MSPRLHPFSVAAGVDLPTRLPSPFANTPHPVALSAAEDLMRRLTLRGAMREGKMFGVLVVRDPEGALGALHAFSGMLDGKWIVEGFSPPLFDSKERDSFWPTGQARLAELDARLRALDEGAHADLRREEAALLTAHEATRATLDQAQRARRHARHVARQASTIDDAIEREARADSAARRRLLKEHRDAHAPIRARADALLRERAALSDERLATSNTLLARLWATYRIFDARGEARPLTSFYQGAPPGGAGDCAAPKLLAEAHARRLRPIALAEFWWGPAPLAGDRRAGSFYPACRGKCGPLLPFMLQGVDVDEAPLIGAASIATDEPRIVYEDEWVTVVDKPCGLLSVAGRHAALADCVEARLGQRVVHRLDVDTSGLLIAAKDAETHAALSGAFARREIDKRYVACLDGDVSGDAGVIELALRGDLDDRPRQIFDPRYGKPARTEWRVLSRASGRTRIALTPRTGRTHQLRVHCAHPRGLAAPIVGDRLYGREAERLMLHAEALSFVHPRTLARVELVRPTPF